MSQRSSLTASQSTDEIKRYQHGTVRLYDATKLPLETQRAILDLSQLGDFDPLAVSRQLGCTASEVRSIAARGIVQPRACKRRRCSCGALIVCEPCMTCESRRVHGVRS